jgi:hypothetical protein
MVTVLGAAVGALAIVAATVLEELTHLAAGRPWAVRQRIDLHTLHAFQEIPEETSRRVDIWISLAPFFVGLAGMALLVVGRGVPPLSDETVLFWFAWAWFTTPSLTDVKAAAGNNDPEVADLSDPKLRATWTGGTIMSVGVLLLYGYDELAEITGHLAPELAPWVATYGLRGGVWIALAGLIWIFVLLEFDTDHAPGGEWR